MKWAILAASAIVCFQAAIRAFMLAYHEARDGNAGGFALFTAAALIALAIGCGDVLVVPDKVP